MKIKIRKSPTADTRTCDWSKVTKEQLETSSRQHIGDVQEGLVFLAKKLLATAVSHDRTKLSHLQEFFDDFTTGFKNSGWWEMHQKEERHHFQSPDSVPVDVNLIDVLEQIVDGVMAGLARSGEYRSEPVHDSLLQKAYANTARMLLSAVEVMNAETLEVFERGVNDAYLDQCENCPFGSVGGLDNRDAMTAPQYIPAYQADDYIAGYRRGALQMYGPDWETAVFSWKPAFLIRKSDGGKADYREAEAEALWDIIQEYGLTHPPSCCKDMGRPCDCGLEEELKRISGMRGREEKRCETCRYHGDLAGNAPCPDCRDWDKWEGE